MGEFPQALLADHIFRPDYGVTTAASSSGAYHFLRITDLTERGVNWSKVPRCDVPPVEAARKSLQKGDLVVARIGATTGKAHLVADPPLGAVFASYLIRIRCKPSLIPEYLGVFTKSHSYDSQISAQKGGRLKGGVTIPVLERLQISLPSVSEQEAISNALVSVGQCIEARRGELELERERKDALMDFLFSHGTRGEERRASELGEVPESWTIRKISDLGLVQSGSTPSRKSPHFFGGTIPWVKTLDLSETWLTRTEEHITQEGMKSIRGKLRPVGTIMVAMYGGAGTIGKAGILQIPATTNQAVCCIEPRQGVYDSEFLFHYLVHHRKSWMKYAIGTRKDPNISKGVVERFQVPIPPLEEQGVIGRVISACANKIQTLQSECELLEELFSAMLEELMSGRLSVQPIIEAAV